jgi:alpha-beta hydrolase superfamily lysophospholipase
MNKLFIKNRDNKKICVVVDETKNSSGLVFIMHGLGGTKDQKHIESLAKTYKNNNFIVVRFDARNTFGESEGKFSDATITNYYKDLEDVISWSGKQKWYKEPFYLLGHSLGGICVILYAQKNPEKVKALNPISTVVSGKLSLESPKNKDWRKWKKSGWNTYIGSSGNIKKLPWSHYEDRLKYDILKSSDKIIVPTLLIVGEKDENTPVVHVKKLYDKLKCKKEMHIIKGAPHTFKEEKHLSEIKNIMDRWIKKTNK